MPAADYVSEREPNDTQASAMPIAGSGTWGGTVGGSDQADFYVLRGKGEQEWASVELSGGILLEIVDEAGAVAARYAGPARIPNLRSTSLLRIISQGGVSEYRLGVVFRPSEPGFELEPNDRCTEATHFPFQSAISGFHSTPDDVDCYQLAIPQALDDGGALRGISVTVTRLEGVSFEGELSLGDKTYKGRGGLGEPLAFRGIDLPADAGEAQLILRGFGASADHYTIGATLERLDDFREREPNDTIAQASELAPDLEHEGYISPPTDVDFWRFEADGGGVATFSVSGLDGWNVALAFITEGSKPFVVNEGGIGEPERISRRACRDHCYVRVTATAGEGADADAAPRYELTGTLEPLDAGTEVEPNDTVATALTLSPGVTMRGTISPRGDRDYYRIDLRTQEVKTKLVLRVTGVALVDLALQLYRVEANGTRTLVQTADTGKRGAPEMLQYAAPPGLYLLGVADASDRTASAFDDYQLVWDERP